MSTFPNFQLPLGTFEYEPYCQQYWVKFTHAGHVILQLTLYKLCSKHCSDLSKSINWQFFHYKLSNPKNHQFWHLNVHQAQRSTTKFSVTRPTLSLQISKIFNIFYLSFLLGTTGTFYINHIVSNVELCLPILIMPSCR